MSDPNPTDNQQPDKPAVLDTSNAGAKTEIDQAHIDRIVDERLKRDRESRDKKLMERFKITNLDELDGILTKARERDESELTAAQKLEKQLEDANKKSEGYEAQIKALLAQQRIDKRNDALKALAAKAGALDSEDVIAWAEKQSSIEAVLKEDNTIDEKAAQKLIDDAKKAKPHFFASGGVGSPSNNGGRVPKGDAAKVIGSKPFGNL